MPGAECSHSGRPVTEVLRCVLLSPKQQSFAATLCLVLAAASMQTIRGWGCAGASGSHCTSQTESAPASNMRNSKGCCTDSASFWVLHGLNIDACAGRLKRGLDAPRFILFCRHGRGVLQNQARCMAPTCNPLSSNKMAAGTRLRSRRGSYEGLRRARGSYEGLRRLTGERLRPPSRPPVPSHQR